MGLEKRPPAEGSPADANEAAPAASRAESSTPTLQPPGAPTPNVPPIAAKADDLDAIKKAVDDAASVGGGLWLSYLFVLFYLAVAAGAVTHADLFLENSVKLPFLNVELPLLAFFFLAPILFLFVHAYTLVHLVFLTDKAKRFDEALHKRSGDEDSLRRQLPSNIFIQFLAGAPEVRAGAFGWLLRVIAWSTLAVAPIFLLLLMQIQFLPFHNSFITWTQRIVLLAELALLWWLWRKILRGHEALKGRPWARGPWGMAGVALSVSALLFSWTAATFPGEWQEDYLPSARVFPVVKFSEDRGGQSTQQSAQSIWAWAKGPWDWVWTSRKVSLHDWVFRSEVDPASRRRWLPFSNTLVLTGFNIYEGLGIDDPKKAEWRNFVFRARGRDLKGAIFDLAFLPKVDFTGAQLQGSGLVFAQLPGARLDDAQLRGALLNDVVLEGASLDDAQLQGASLDDAQLRGASLAFTHLEGASLLRAHLQGASLFGAKLQGASLDGADLQGTRLDQSRLDGASLSVADILDASAGCTRLRGEFLSCMHVNGAPLYHPQSKPAQLLGASLDGASLHGASLKGAQLQGASLQLAGLEGTDLSGTNLWRTNRAVFSAAELLHFQNFTRVVLPEQPDTWQPMWLVKNFDVHLWDKTAYQEVRATIASLPQGDLRERALDRIRSLDCSNPEGVFASCDPSASTPDEAVAWRKILEDAREDEAGYERDLNDQLEVLACRQGDANYFILRGLLRSKRIEAAGVNAPPLVDFIMSKDCPVSALLTDGDKTRLLTIKQQAEKAAK
jgi:uncharacterized protein YjbI with pentapeptide repeats